MDLLSDESPWNPERNLQSKRASAPGAPELSPAQAPIADPPTAPSVPLAVLAHERHSHETQQLRWYGLNV